jgi:hypothetical protein
MKHTKISSLLLTPIALLALVAGCKSQTKPESTPASSAAAQALISQKQAQAIEQNANLPPQAKAAMDARIQSQGGSVPPAGTQ